MFVAFGQNTAQTPQSRKEKLALADKAFEEGTKLRNVGTTESLQMAIMQLQTAREIYAQVSDKFGEAFVSLLLGQTFSDLGKNQEALNYYNQALSIQ